MVQQVAYVNDPVTTLLMTLVHSDVFLFYRFIQQFILLHHVKGDHIGLLQDGGAIFTLFFTTSVSPDISQMTSTALA